MLFSLGKHEIAVILGALLFFLVGVPTMMAVAAAVLRRAKRRIKARWGRRRKGQSARAARDRVPLRGEDRR